MLKPDQLVKIKWGSKNKRRLVSLGYEFTHIGDEVEVRVEHLSKGSCGEITYICDYCGAEIITQYNTYMNSHKYCDKDACKKCASLKSRDAFKSKYGVTNPLQVPEINQKQRKTCLEKYGTEHVLQNKEILAKKDATCIERYGESSVLLNNEIAQKKRETCLNIYGCEIPTQNKAVMEKMKKTNLEKYGVEYSAQAQKVKDKMRKTLKERYGVEYTLQNPEFNKKARISSLKTMLEHGTIPTSKAQYVIYDMCKNIYGDDNVTLNKLLNTLALDIELLYDNIKIDIEYDGTYWHKDEQKDRRRDEIVKKYGYKILRIRGKQNPPTKEQLVEAIDKLVFKDYNFTTINVDI